MSGQAQVFAAVFFAGLALATAIRWRYTRLYRRMRRGDVRREPLVVRVLMPLWAVAQALPFVAVFTTWLDVADYALPAPLGILGIVALAAGLWLLRRSHADLGRNWSPSLIILQDHALVTTGVYARIRHPMYAAHWLWVVGQALLIHNWIAGPAGLLVFAPIYVLRVGPEEAQLRARFGAAYLSYEERTGRLFPRLGRQPSESA